MTLARESSPLQRSARGIGPAREGPRRRRQGPSGFPWILPTLIISIGFIYSCVGYTGLISVYEWDGISPNPEPVGLGNYIALAGDRVVRLTVQHTVVYILVTFAVETVLGFTFAAILHSGIKFRTAYKILVFSPVIIAPAIMAPVFRQVYAADGQFNQVLEFLGLGAVAQPWLAQSSTALGVIIAIGVWERTGLYFILYFAAMSQIDQEMIEAGWIDGAGNLRVLVSIVWPNVAGTTVALAVLQAIYTLKLFDVPYLVSEGGPSFSTEFLGTYIYRQAITQSHVGYAAALSILLLVLALLLTFGLNLRRRREGEAG